MDMDKNKLAKLRQDIDRIDNRIIDLINRRYRLAQKVGQWKRGQGLKVYVPEREKTLLDRLETLNPGPMTPTTLRAIYREIISGAIALEKPLTIAYLGPQATFTHLAALRRFGHAADFQPKLSIPDIFTDVETERADYGVVPVENSTEGAVNHTLDMFLNTGARICAEINMRIHHHLMAKGPMDKIRRVYSHAQVLGQTRSWLQTHLPGVELVETSSSTKAAETAAAEKHAAAVSSRLAAELYGLDILAEHIEDSAENTTRFLVIGRQDPKPTGDDKTSICYAIKDKVGALYETLLPFKQEKVTLTMIESRPSRRKNWEYCFFVDFIGHADDPVSQRVFEQLKEHCQFARILGSYPRSSDIP